ncbi:MAG TPA: trypsin-like peptidase domain-containing protein [Candidatus Bathyarchaeia archaeon]|nr:trypsin-like peptidase domain-containing protein [Candidatus Bathyarchaeia archaeon]
MKRSIRRRSHSRNSKVISSRNNRTISVLLLVIIILGSVALYYSPLLDGIRTKHIDPATIYANSSKGVVTVRGITDNSSVLGTGFVIYSAGSNYIVTNYHVVDGFVSPTVTFSDGNAYVARVVGSDGYSDLAIISVTSPASEFHPLQLGSSSNLEIGETVVAIGNPYGLSNTITVGIVSQTGRSIQTGTLGNFAIANTIQFSAPVNPGNSGGPLINSDGMVIGITAASVTSGQGLSFAIPSDTISRELPSLIKNGKYDLHPYLGLQLVDMNYELSHAMNTNITSGVLIVSAVAGGPASNAGLRGGTQRVIIDRQRFIIGGDIITSLNGHKVVNYDSLSAYLEDNAVSGQTVKVGIIRQGAPLVVQVELGTRPPFQA